MKRTVVVCGGSKGIGAATVKILLSEGFKVICVSRSKGELSELYVDNKELEFIECDMSNKQSRKELCEMLKNVDIYGLINNASGPAPSSIEATIKESYESAFETHLYAADEIVKALLPLMIKNNSGRIVNIISVTAKIPLENMSVSNTVRGAMLNWSKTLSKEMGKHNITVNNVLPGYTLTQRLSEVISGVSKNLGISENEYSDKILQQVPLKRFGKAKEIAAVVAFLVSDNASFVTGVSIPVDGGWTPSA